MRPHSVLSLSLVATLGLLSIPDTAFGVCAPTGSNLVAWWPGDVGAEDIVGEHPAYLYNGAATYPAGEVGQSLYFDGIDDYLAAFGSPDFDPGTSMTVDAWIWFGAADTEPRMIVARSNGGFAGYALFAARNPQGGGVTCTFLVATTVGLYQASVQVSAEHWTHVAGTYDGSEARISLYTDGQRAFSQTGPPASIVPVIGEPLTIGAQLSGGYFYYPWGGNIDEVHFWNRALSEAEVQNLHGALTQGACRPQIGCLNVGVLTACSTAFAEDPAGSGIWYANGSSTFGTGTFRPFGIRGGQLKVIPANGFASFNGTLYLRTPNGNLDLYTYNSSSRLGLNTNGTPWKPGELVQNLTRNMSALPDLSSSFSITPGALGFDPPDTGPLAGLAVDFDSGCVTGSPQFQFGLPEGASVNASGEFSVCADPYSVTGSLTHFDAKAAGVEIAIDNATIYRYSPTDHRSALWIERARLKVPFFGGNAEGEARDLVITPTSVNLLGGGEFKLPPLDFGAFKLGGASAGLYLRDPSWQGYELCALGEFQFPQAHLGINFNFTFMGGEFRQGCFGALFPATPIVPGMPVYVDYLGGCLELGGPIAESERCSFATPIATTVTDCLSGRCGLGDPNVTIVTRVLAGPPSDVGLGYLIDAYPVNLAFGPAGFSASADINVLGQYIGGGQICVNSWGAEVCGAIDYLRAGVVIGQANLRIDGNGVTGRVYGCFDPPAMKRCVWGTNWCSTDDLPAFNAQVALGDFEASNSRHYGFTASIGACAGCTGNISGCWPSGSFGVDVRTGSVFFGGIRELSSFSPSLPRGLAPEGTVASESAQVPVGAPTASFGARSASGIPTITLMSPSGDTLDSASAGIDVHDIAEDNTRFLVVSSPEAGAWTMFAGGLPAGASAETIIATDVMAASVALSEPFSDTGSRMVTWTATIPETAFPTKLLLIAAPDDASLAAGAGTIVHEELLAAGPGFFEIPEGLLPAGTWGILLRLDDEHGHVDDFPAFGHVLIEDTTGPEPPASAELFALIDGVRVAWEPSPSADAIAYEVLVQDPDDATSESVLDAGEKLQLDIENLLPGMERRFLVRAVDRSGNAGPALDAGLGNPDLTADSTGPAAPTGFALSAQGANGIHVAWNAAASATVYLVRYGIHEDLAGAQADQGASPVSGAGTALDLTGFASGSRIFVAVSALDAQLNEGPRTETRSFVVTSGVDSDHDGLPDDWEMLWMGSAASDGSADGDADYMTDAEEFALGLDPLVRNLFEWGDLAPVGAPNGKVDVADVVRGLALAVGSSPTNADERRRGNVSPATLVPGENGGPDLVTPTLAPPEAISVSDLVLMLRAAVNLARFTIPFAI